MPTLHCFHNIAMSYEQAWTRVEGGCKDITRSCLNKSSSPRNPFANTVLSYMALLNQLSTEHVIYTRTSHNVFAFKCKESPISQKSGWKRDDLITFRFM